MPSTSTKRNHSKHSSSKSKKAKKSKEYITSDSDLESTGKLSAGSSEDEGEWVVEKVVGKRNRNGVTEYFIKWKDWPSSTNTWEPLSNLTNCPQLVEQYEEGLVNEKKKKHDEAPAEPNGFERGWKAVGVRGVAPFDFSKNKEIYYLVEWENTEALERIPSGVVRDKIPHKLITYLEEDAKLDDEDYQMEDI